MSIKDKEQPKIKVFDEKLLRREDKIKSEVFSAELVKLDDINIINDAKLERGIHLMRIPSDNENASIYFYALGGYTLDKELENKVFRAGYMRSDNKIMQFNLYLMPIVSSSGNPIAIETPKIEGVEYSAFILPEDYMQFKEIDIEAISKNGIMLKYMISAEPK